MPLKAQGEFALMQDHVEAAFRLGITIGAVPGGDHLLHGLLADAAAEQRDRAALEQYAPLAEATARRNGHRMQTAIAQRAWGVAHTLAGEYDKAEDQLQQALEIFRAYAAPWQIGRTLFEMGELSRAQANAAQARQRYAEALQVFEQLRAAPYVARTRLALGE